MSSVFSNNDVTVLSVSHLMSGEKCTQLGVLKRSEKEVRKWRLLYSNIGYEKGSLFAYLLNGVFISF